MDRLEAKIEQIADAARRAREFVELPDGVLDEEEVDELIEEMFRAAANASLLGVALWRVSQKQRAET